MDVGGGRASSRSQRPSHLPIRRATQDGPTCDQQEVPVSKLPALPLGELLLEGDDGLGDVEPKCFVHHNVTSDAGNTVVDG